MAKSESWMIQGPSPLEVQAHITQLRPIWVLSHPHPVFGGSMENKIIDQVFRRMVDQQMSVVRYNFRGVGQSQGQYDQAVGEIDDLRAVVHHVLEEYTEQSRNIALLGYSFGAYISAMVAQTIEALHCLHLVAPPMQMKPFPHWTPNHPVHLWMPAQDQYTQVQDARQYAEKLPGDIHWHEVPNADHYFIGATAQWLRMFFKQIAKTT
jgi:alpha/beta superfamily hydrolase